MLRINVHEKKKTGPITGQESSGVGLSFGISSVTTFASLLRSLSSVAVLMLITDSDLPSPCSLNLRLLCCHHPPPLSSPPILSLRPLLACSTHLINFPTPSSISIHSSPQAAAAGSRICCCWCSATPSISAAVSYIHG